MDTNKCINCGRVIPKNRTVCLRCENEELKFGKILQTINATEEEVEDAYNWLYSNLEDAIDMT